MALPFFYIDAYDAGQTHILLNEETSKHIVQVLRMKVGEPLNLTDGNGHLLTCSITDDHKKHCAVGILSAVNQPLPAKKVSIAISLIKNSNRFEWFLEKATEIGVKEIIPLLCERTEKERFRYDRMLGICISAMLQSQQTWLPLLREPVPFENIENWKLAEGQHFIAHCIDASKGPLSDFHVPGTAGNRHSPSIICIGPEGDFTPGEVDLALQHGFLPVSLGETRLRTETAGVVAAALLVNRTL